MPSNVGLFCKSFRGDFKPLSFLLETFARHNPENLLLTLSLPKSDIQSFRNSFGSVLSNVSVIEDESYTPEDLSKYSGWHSQQICKLASYQAVDSKHYLVVDSDCYFLRDIKTSDITPRNGARFSVFGSKLRTVYNAKQAELVEYLCRENPDETQFALEAPAKKMVDGFDSTYSKYRSDEKSKLGPLERSDIAFKIFGRKEWTYFQPGQIFSSELVERLGDYLQEHGFRLGDAITLCPWEYNWYGEYAAACYFHETDFRISTFFHFQSEADLSSARSNGITPQLLAKNFLIVQMAARHIRELWL